MMEKSPGIKEWRELYKLIVELKEIAPWQWLEEQDLIAVQNPETKEIGFVSVMGAIGEHHAIAVYLGEKGYYRFRDFQQSTPDTFSFQKILEMPQLQASFEDRGMLHEKDREIIKNLSLTFRGKQSWPMFRSYKPGFFPWYLNSSEARFLKYALEQTIDVSLRAKKDRSLLRPYDDATYLLRKMVKKGNTFSWQDSTWKESPPAPHKIEPQIDMIAIERLKKVFPQKITLEIDVFMSPQPVQEKGARPYYPYVLMLIDANNGMIVDHQLIPPLPDLESMWEKIPSLVADIFAKRSLLPERILVSSDFLYQFLYHLSDNQNISVEFLEELPNVNEARISFMEYLQ